MAEKNSENENEIERSKASIELIQLSKKETIILRCWNETLKQFKPKCIVFDLDFTLWPFLIDSQILPPLKTTKSFENDEFKVKVHDHDNKLVNHYEDTTLIIKMLKDRCFADKSFHLAIASRATVHNLAMELFEIFGWSGYFDSIQIYSGNKIKHLKQIKNELKLKSFNEILFFDDNKSNLESTETLGVVGHQVRRHYGLNVAELVKGLEKFNLLQRVSTNPTQTTKAKKP